MLRIHNLLGAFLLLALFLPVTVFPQFEDRGRDRDRDRGDRERDRERERGGFPGGGFPPGNGFPGGGGFPGSGGFPGGAGFPGAFPSRSGFPGGGIPGGGFPSGNFRDLIPSRSGSSRSSESNNWSADPLVPGFGETTLLPAVPAFGQRVMTGNSFPISGGSSAVSAAEESRKKTEDAVQKFISRYDKDKNNLIEKRTDEWKDLKIDTNLIDPNHDMVITPDELRNYFAAQTNGGNSNGAANKVFTTYSTAYEHLPEGVPPWYLDRDKDHDGQLSLFEYANIQTITREIAEEFEFLDLNNDGILTVSECYQAIKAKEEAEQKTKEQEKRDKEKASKPSNTSPSGIPASASGTPQWGNERNRNIPSRSNGRGGDPRGTPPRDNNNFRGDNRGNSNEPPNSQGGGRQRPPGSRVGY
ncbi:MAG: hypothetical protein LBQ54_13965 [Planctomycetaceae bacterium]|jgi:Ca2+-binding EF-hand superfamily protein|nr:hypothetical protein [Planctomycetaceae bacterium]